MKVQGVGQGGTCGWPTKGTQLYNYCGRRYRNPVLVHCKESHDMKRESMLQKLK